MEVFELKIIEESEELSRLSLKGNMGLRSSGELSDQIQSLFDRGYYRIDLDCCYLNTIASPCLGVLLRLGQTALDHSGKIRLVDLPQTLEESIRRFGLQNTLIVNPPDV